MTHNAKSPFIKVYRVISPSFIRERLANDAPALGTNYIQYDAITNYCNIGDTSENSCKSYWIEIGKNVVLI